VTLQNLPDNVSVEALQKTFSYLNAKMYHMVGSNSLNVSAKYCFTEELLQEKSNIFSSMLCYYIAQFNVASEMQAIQSINAISKLEVDGQVLKVRFFCCFSSF
jgi:hypothetical protein